MSQEAAVKMIREFHDGMANKNHYELLEVPTDADVKQVKAAYRRLVKMFHVDSFRGVELGDAAALLDPIIHRVGEASNTLSHPERRAAYDAQLSTGTVPESERVSESQIEEIFAAEDAFRRGKAFVDRGQFEAALERFGVALRVNPHDPDTLAYHKFARLMTLPVGANGRRGPESEKLLKELQALASENKDRLIPVWINAKALKAVGDEGKALTAFKRVLFIDEKHADSNREIRLLQARASQEKVKKNETFMDKLKRLLSKKL